MKLMVMLPENSDFIQQLNKKLAPPMVTLLSAEPEIQYVALRNINLIVQKRFGIFLKKNSRLHKSGENFSEQTDRKV